MILAIVQGRLSSTRLPGKVLAPLEGEPMIMRQLDRVRRARSIDQLVVATSDDPSDDPLADALEARGVVVRRGPLNDVFSRFALVIDEFAPDDVVRLTADNPLADPEVIDLVVGEHLAAEADYTSNSRVRSFPYGLDAECFRADAFERVRAGTLSAYDREHVTPAFYADGAPYRVHQVVGARDLSDLRWSVDYPEDLAFVRSVYSALLPVDPEFTWHDVVRLLDAHPELLHRVGDVG